MKYDFFENFLLLAVTIRAAGDKWAGHGGPALPLQKQWNQPQKAQKAQK